MDLYPVLFPRLYMSYDFCVFFPCHKGKSLLTVVVLNQLQKRMKEKQFVLWCQEVKHRMASRVVAMFDAASSSVLEDLFSDFNPKGSEQCFK